MKTLIAQRPTFLTLYYTVLVILWVGATLANVATIFGLSVDVAGLIGISIFVGAAIVRSYRGSAL